MNINYLKATKLTKVLQDINPVRSAVKSVVAAGAAITAASSLSVAATSAAGITSALAAAGAVIGGGMAAGPVALSLGPTGLMATIMNRLLFQDQPALDGQERLARKAARAATGIGAMGGMVAAGSMTVAGGASGAAIMSTLAGIGGFVGGGAIAGTVVVVLSPAVVTGVAGYAAYKLFGGAQKRSS